jgi:hypothetical protein
MIPALNKQISAIKYMIPALNEQISAIEYHFSARTITYLSVA